MRSPSAESSRAVTRAALVLACAAASAGAARADDAAVALPPLPAASIAELARLSPVERARRIDAAASALRADPLISGRHKEHDLQWKKDDDKPKPKEKREPESHWFSSLVDFINDSSRVLFWGIALVLVVVGLVSGRHLVELRGLRRRGALPGVVSHVRELDVRPESLPADVGAAAWAMWQAGQVPAALSLLYRGALSRLIHRHQVPITASITEGECLDLARNRLDAATLGYVTRVVRAWQASTYGGRALSAAMGEALCTAFAERLDAAPAATGASA